VFESLCIEGQNEVLGAEPDIIGDVGAKSPSSGEFCNYHFSK